MNGIFRRGRLLQPIRGVTFEWQKQVRLATGKFMVFEFFFNWSDDATLQEMLNEGSNLFQDKSLYHPALRPYLQELLGHLKMAHEVRKEDEGEASGRRAL